MASPPTPEGPNHMPPQLPDGWVAQLEGNTGKYYYVEMATARTQWDVPTQPAPSVPSPFPTPQQNSDPYAKPDGSAVPLNADGSEQTEADRSLLGNLAINAITGGKVKPQNQSGLGSLASSFLGGQSSHSGGGSSGGGGGSGIGGSLGHLVGGLFADKPNNQQQQSHSNQQSSGYGGSGSAGAQQGGGMMGFLGSHHGSSNNNFGYSSTGQGSSGGYSEQAPPATYKPPGKQSSSQYGSLSGVNHMPLGQAPHNSYQAASSSVQYVQVQQQQAQGGANTNSLGHTGASQYGPMTSGSSQYGQTPSHSTTSLPLYGHNNLSNQSVYSQNNPPFPGPPGEHHGHHHKPPQGNYGQQQNQMFPGPPNGSQNTSQNDYPGQQNTSYPNQPPSSYASSHPSPLAYGQQNGSSYAPQPQSAPYYGHPPPPPQSTPYDQQGPPPQSAPYGQQQPPPYNPYPQSQTSFPPPSQSTPAYTTQHNNPPYDPQSAQHNQASFNANASAPPPVPPMSSHPSQQGSGPGPGPGQNQGLTPGQHPYPPRPNSSQSGTYPGQVPYPSRPTSGTGPSPGQGYPQTQHPPQPPPKDDFPIPVNHHPQQPAYGQQYGTGHPQGHLPHDGYLTGGLVFGQGGGAPPPPPSWRA